MDPVSQKAVASTHLFLFPIESGLTESNHCLTLKNAMENCRPCFETEGRQIFSLVSLSVFSASEYRSLLCFLVEPFTPQTRSDLQSLIKCAFQQQKQCFYFLNVSYCSLTLCCLTLVHIQILCSSSFNGPCLLGAEVVSL